jgi:glycerate dehydrogenase
MDHEHNGCGVFLDRKTMHPQDLDFGALDDTLAEWRYYDTTTPEQLDERLRDATVVVANKVFLDDETLARADRLRLVCVAATGVNNIDLDAAQRLGLPVCNVRAYGTPSVAQHVFALILALATRLFDYRDAVRSGRWPDSELFCLLDHPIVELSGKVLGIVGYGELGRAVGRLAEAFGMSLLVAERRGNIPRAGRLPLEAVLRRCDVLSVHCPLTAETRGLIGSDELALLKPSAFLINTARGGIVDERALARALRDRRLAGAGVDVLSEEPPPKEHVLLAPDIPNLLVTPHVAWASRQARQRALDQVALNIASFFRGEPRNLL